MPLSLSKEAKFSKLYNTINNRPKHPTIEGYKEFNDKFKTTGVKGTYTERPVEVDFKRLIDTLHADISKQD